MVRGGSTSFGGLILVAALLLVATIVTATDYRLPNDRIFTQLEYRNGTKTSASNIAFLGSDDTSSVGLSISNIGSGTGTNQGIALQVTEPGAPSDDRQLVLELFGGRVMVGTTSFQTSDKFVVNGPIRIADPGVQPTCTSSIAPMIWYDAGGAGVKDNVQVCAKDAANVYAWRVLY